MFSLSITFQTMQPLVGVSDEVFSPLYLEYAAVICTELK